MAIKKEITFEGTTYSLGEKDRVAAYTAATDVSIIPEVTNWYPNGVGALTDATTALVAGTIYTYVDANGGANALPVLGIGERIKVLIKTASGSTVYTCGSGQTIHTSSYATICDIVNGDAAFAATATALDNTFTVNKTTTGGVGGDEYDFIGISSSLIMITARLNGSGTLVTPFSTV